VLSVGGGNREKNVSVNLVKALEYTHKVGARILDVVGRDCGYTAQVADACIIIPVVNSGAVTPIPKLFRASSGTLLSPTHCYAPQK
jgi:D-sedoheptulose 7-phosphate isomerase